MKWLLIIAAVSQIVGCGHLVRVQDNEGNRLCGASVVLAAPSFFTPLGQTNSDGELQISRMSFVGEINVSLSGYYSDTVPWPNQWPLLVTMRKGSGNLYRGQIVELINSDALNVQPRQ